MLPLLLTFTTLASPFLQSDAVLLKTGGNSRPKAEALLKQGGRLDKIVEEDEHPDDVAERQMLEGMAKAYDCDPTTGEPLPDGSAKRKGRPPSHHASYAMHEPSASDELDVGEEKDLDPEADMNLNNALAGEGVGDESDSAAAAAKAQKARVTRKRKSAAGSEAGEPASKRGRPPKSSIPTDTGSSEVDATKELLAVVGQAATTMTQMQGTLSTLLKPNKVAELKSKMDALKEVLA